MAAAAGRFDLIIDTVPYQHDVNPYVPTLATGGTIVMAATSARWSRRSNPARWCSSARRWRAR